MHHASGRCDEQISSRIPGSHPLSFSLCRIQSSPCLSIICLCNLPLPSHPRLHRGPWSKADIFLVCGNAHLCFCFSDLILIFFSLVYLFAEPPSLVWKSRLKAMFQFVEQIATTTKPQTEEMVMGIFSIPLIGLNPTLFFKHLAAHYGL